MKQKIEGYNKSSGIILENFIRLLRRFRLRYLKQDFQELTENVSKTDLLYLSIFPLIITIIMFLPESLKETLKLNIYNPSWWQIFTSSFIHHNLKHYLDNLIPFIILLSIQFPVISKIKEQKVYFYLIIFTVVSFTIFSSVIEIFFYPTISPNTKFSAGSSGLVSAFFGFTPVIWVYYFYKLEKRNLIDKNFFNIVLFYIVLSFLIIYYSYYQNLILIFSILFLVLISAYWYGRNLKYILHKTSSEIDKNIILYCLLISLPIFFIFAPKFLFPKILITDGGYIDIFMHYIGIFYGFVVSYIFFKFTGVIIIMKKINSHFLFVFIIEIFLLFMLFKEIPTDIITSVNGSQMFAVGSYVLIFLGIIWAWEIKDHQENKIKETAKLLLLISVSTFFYLATYSILYPIIMFPFSPLIFLTFALINLLSGIFLLTGYTAGKLARLA